MEDLIFVLLEFLAELIFQWPIDRTLSTHEKRAQDEDRALRYGMAAIVAVVIGAALGWMGAAWWPGFWPVSAVGRGFMILVAPVLLGYVSYAINEARSRGGKDWLRPWRHAACAGLFALAWAITRTVLAS